jgi:hypothetical protein
LHWDIEVGENIKHLQGMKLEIDLFQKELQEAFVIGETLDFNFESKILKKASEYDMEVSEYIELIEENQFLVDEYNSIKERNRLAGSEVNFN